MIPKLKDLILFEILLEEDKESAQIEDRIRDVFMVQPGSFNTGWKMKKFTYIKFIERLKDEFDKNKVDKIVKALTKLGYIEQKGSEIIWND